MSDFPEHWQLKSIEEAMDALIDYRGKTPKKTASGIPLITAKIVKNGRIHEPSEFIAEDNYDSWMVRGLPEVGDVVVTTEAPLGEVAQINNSNIALAQRIVTLRGKKGLLNNDFLLYAMQSGFIQHQLESRASGSTVKGIKQSELRKVLVPIPPENEQIEIAKHLKSIDSKIALNRQINQTLESISQAIFKSWFVDFEPVKAKIAALESGEDAEGVTRAAMRAISGKTDDELDQLQAEKPEQYSQLKTTAELFPAAMQDSELGGVPKGWEVGCVGDVTKKIFSGGTPNTKTEAFWNGELNWFSSGETRNIVIVDTEKKITEKGAKGSSTKLAIYGDILIASAGQGHTRGQTSFCAMDTFINQSVVSIRTRDIRLSSWLFFDLSRRYEEMRSISDSHSIRGSLTTKLLSGLSTIIPSESLCIEYGKIAERSLILIAENMRQSEVLSKLRDTLLPKLISGELEVNAVNKDAEG